MRAYDLTVTGSLIITGSVINADGTSFLTGSNAGAAFICEVVTNVVIHAANGGVIPGTSLTADTLYPIGMKKVVIGSSGVVYILHR